MRSFEKVFMCEIASSRPCSCGLGFALFLVFLLSFANPAQAQVQDTEVPQTQDQEIVLQAINDSSDQDLKQIREKLADLEGRVDAYSPDIGELSLEMGNLLAAQGDSEGAASAFRRALHVSRINHGLDSIFQLPVLDALLDVQTSTHQIESAGDTLRRMYLVHKQHYPADDPAILKMLMRIGIWHFSAYYFQIDNATVSHLVEARRAFGLAHASPVKAERQYNFDLYNLLAMTDHGLAIAANTTESSPFDRTNNSTGSHQVTSGIINGSYRRGKTLLATGVEEASKTGNTESLARAVLLYADWHQMFNKRQTARKLYVKAYQIARKLPRDNEVRKSFNYPHQLPDFNSKILKFSPKEVDERPVAVKFDVNDWGASANIEILAAGENEEIPHTLKRAARSTVRSAAYRPAMADGQPVDTLDVTQTVIVAL